MRNNLRVWRILPVFLPGGLRTIARFRRRVSYGRLNEALPRDETGFLLFCDTSPA